MRFAQTISGRKYSFGSLRELLARATPLRSGDVLAGIAAKSAEERVAAQYALADAPLALFLSEAVVPYEHDEVTRLIVDTHDAAALIAELLRPGLEGWRPGPMAVVEQGRVAIGDEIGELLGARIAVVLIGERPGLSSPDSLGVYITWEPRTGRMDAERNCISNVRGEGLAYAAAAEEIAFILKRARECGLTGIGLRTALAPMKGESWLAG